MRCISITTNIEIAYLIDGYPNYVVVKGGDVYNAKTSKKIKKTVVGYSKGIWLGKSFLTKEKLLGRLIKQERINFPF